MFSESLIVNKYVLFPSTPFLECLCPMMNLWLKKREASLKTSQGELDKRRGREITYKETKNFNLSSEKGKISKISVQ